MTDETITRTQHLAWCKKRALEYVDRGEFLQALSSMLSDMRKHREVGSPMLFSLILNFAASSEASDAAKVRKFILDFN